MTSAPEHIENFAVADNHLIRSVVPAPAPGRKAKPYEHRCPRKSFEQIAHAADELGEAGFTLEDLADAAPTTNTQAAVALAFMKERGCVVTRYRRNYAASRCLFEDAMTEYWALAETSSPD